MKTAIKDRFLKYIAFDTQSDEESTTYPSTLKQTEFAQFLIDELKAIGFKDVEIDKFSYVTATLPANIDNNAPVIGFLAHYDTSPDIAGGCTNPKIIENYNGKDIVLNIENDIILKTDDFPEIKNYIGKTIITTDGTTLLGADDKAGVVEIIEAMRFLIANPEIKHGKIRIAFTPDEEVGRGVDNFDVAKFGADFAYTVDGGAIGELEYENFNAASGKVYIQGRNIHPGYAKDKMINASLVSIEFNAMLPDKMRPEFTSGYEGFYHLTKMNCSVENATIEYIIREHDNKKFEEMKLNFADIAKKINQKYSQSIVKIEITDQYRNMREMVEPHFYIVKTARKAMELCNITPIVKPIRGGTDGARLSYMGLPCPNIFTGGHNFHGKFEFIPLQSMEKAVNVIVKIAELFSKKR